MLRWRYRENEYLLSIPKKVRNDDNDECMEFNLLLKMKTTKYGDDGDDGILHTATEFVHDPKDLAVSDRLRDNMTLTPDDDGLSTFVLGKEHL